MVNSALCIVVVLPDLLGTYGDSGNATVLAARAAWRGIPVEVVRSSPQDPFPASGDIYCLGGGEDGPQIEAAQLLTSRADPAQAIDSGATVLAVCAGFQVLGQEFPRADGRCVAGVGVLPVTTTKGTGPRAVGELMGSWRRPGQPSVRLTGYENHGGVTILEDGVDPLMEVESGIGNGAGRPVDGIRVGKVIGTYMHGPVLARNPQLADHLLELALGSPVGPIDEPPAIAELRNQREAACRRAGQSLLRRWVRLSPGS